jgi:hypothetical protein
MYLNAVKDMKKREPEKVPKAGALYSLARTVSPFFCSQLAFLNRTRADTLMLTLTQQKQTTKRQTQYPNAKPNGTWTTWTHGVLLDL